MFAGKNHSRPGPRQNPRQPLADKSRPAVPPYHQSSAERRSPPSRGCKENAICSLVMNGISTASATRCDVCICSKALVRPLSGPRDGGSSKSNSVSSGSQEGSFRAETNIFSGRRSRRSSSCRCQSGWPRKTIVALSLPIRRDSPPASKTAVRVISIAARLSPLSF